MDLQDRIPPQNLEAEQASLGSMMITRNALMVGLEKLRMEDFYREAHGLIFNALEALQKRSDPIDPFTVQEELRSKGRLDAAGGTAYVLALIDSVPTATNIDYYADKVIETAQLRRIIDLGSRAISWAHSQEDESRDILARMYDEALRLTQGRNGGQVGHVSEALREAFADIEDWHNNPRVVTGIPTGVTGLDYMTSGWQKGDFVLIGARPSHGKSALMLQSVLAAARAGHGVGVLSIEMSRKWLAVRMLAHSARVSMSKMRGGRTEGDEWSRLVDATLVVEQMGIYIEDPKGCYEAKHLPMLARRMAAKGAEVLFIDYLQMMHGDRSENREREIASVSATCKETARACDISVVALAQLNRQSEARADKKPSMADLRESGSQEADADLVMLLHNPRPKDDEHSRQTRDAEIIVAKQRNGRTGPVAVKWDGETQTFTDTETHREREARDYSTGEQYIKEG
jgi:replicative DNA helicase